MITIIKWSDNTINKFHKGDKNIPDFVAWKKQKNPNIKIVLRCNIEKDLLNND